MIVTFCDSCGKQLNRYDRERAHISYDITKSFSLKDKQGSTRGYSTSHLEFCSKCYTKIEAFLNDMTKDLPNEFDVHVNVDRSPYKGE